MTVSVDDELRIREYAGDDSATPRAVPFKFLSNDDLKVTMLAADGSELVLVRGTHYSVSGAGASEGGEVTPLAPIASGTSWRIEGDMGLAQPTDYTAGDDFPAESHERGLDRSMIAHQEARRDINDTQVRALMVPRGEISLVLPVAAARAGYYLAFTADGQPSMASGTGADAGLRVDIASPQGATLVSYGEQTVEAALDWLNTLIVNPLTAGIAGDGATDDSTAVQTVIDANKGKRIVFPAGYTYLMSNVLLDGSDYDGTVLVFEGTVKVGVKTGAGPLSPWMALGLRAVTGATITIRDLDGDRANQPGEEGVHGLIIAGCHDCSVFGFSCREIRGDGIYVGKEDLTADSTNSTNIRLIDIYGRNSAHDGRNLISIISCAGFVIQNVYSWAIGGVINGVRQPGGIDLEPNRGDDIIENGIIDNVYVYSAGTSGFGLFGKSIGGADAYDWNIRNIAIGTVNLTRDAAATGYVLAAYRAINVSYGVLSVDTNGAGGVTLDYCRSIRGRVEVRDASTHSLLIGYSGDPDRLDLTINLDGYTSVGLGIMSCDYSTIRGRVFGAASGASTFAIRMRPLTRTITNTGLILEVDAPYDGLNARAMRTEAGDTGTLTLGTGTMARNCDWSGYASFAAQCDLAIPTVNVGGRNVRNTLSAAPVNGQWATHDEVTLNQVAGSLPSRARCIAGGGPGTWKTCADLST